MSVTNIPERIRYCLWGRAAGRCQYEGCNQPLYVDSVTKVEFNVAYIAHIIADSPKGPRGHPELSERLAKDISNLMLMCDVHHRLIDKEDVAGHPIELLRSMKEKQEERIERVTEIREHNQSHILLYGANIGEHSSPLSYNEAALGLSSIGFYPASKNTIQLGLKNSSLRDREELYWKVELEHLRRHFHTAVRERLKLNQIEHLSVFALAPIPLLIELGRLLSDIPRVQVFQRRREPPTWKWDGKQQRDEFSIERPTHYESKRVALVVALSADIISERITSVLGEDVCIWKLTHRYPSVDFLRSSDQLSSFRQIFRNLLNEIKKEHGEETELHLFPAIPVAIAVEVGRVWMPKADLDIRVYDQNKSLGGFVQVSEVTQSS